MNCLIRIGASCGGTPARRASDLQRSKARRRAALGARPAFEPGRRVPQAMRTGSPTQARCRLTRRVACRSGGRPRTAVR